MLRLTRRGPLLGVLGLALGGSAAWGVDYLTAMRMALDTSPQVALATSRLRSQGHELQRARGKHLPTLTVQSGFSSPQALQQRYGATASVNLWSAGALQAQVDQQTASFGALRQGVMAACGDALAQASDAYVMALRADALLALWTAHRNQLDSVLSMVSQIAEVDRGRRIDVEQVLIRRGQVDLARLEAQTAVRQSRLALTRLLASSIEPRAESVTPTVERLMPSSSQQAWDWAREHSPALAAARHDLEAARHGVDVARGARWPQLNLVAQQTRERALGLATTDRSIGLQAQWSVFNGGADLYAERASLEAVQAALTRQEEAQRQAEFNLAQTWEDLQSARQRELQQASQQQPVSAVFEATRELFRLGRRSVLDILNAANDLHSVQVAQLEARHESWARSLRLHNQTGRLLVALPTSASAACALSSMGLPPSLLESLPQF